MLSIPRLLSRRDELLKVQYVSKYLTLAEEGLCPPLECPMDKGSLLPNLNEDDNIILYCISCDWKSIMGLDQYEKIKLQVNKHLLIELKKDGDIEYRENSWKNN